MQVSRVTCAVLKDGDGVISALHRANGMGELWLPRRSVARQVPNIRTSPAATPQEMKLRSLKFFPAPLCLATQADG